MLRNFEHTSHYHSLALHIPWRTLVATSRFPVFTSSPVAPNSLDTSLSFIHWPPEPMHYCFALLVRVSLRIFVCTTHIVWMFAPRRDVLGSSAHWNFLLLFSFFWFCPHTVMISFGPRVKLFVLRLALYITVVLLGSTGWSRLHVRYSFGLPAALQLLYTRSYI